MGTASIPTWVTMVNCRMFFQLQQQTETLVWGTQARKGLSHCPSLCSLPEEEAAVVASVAAEAEAEEEGMPVEEEGMPVVVRNTCGKDRLKCQPPNLVCGGAQRWLNARVELSFRSRISGLRNQGTWLVGVPQVVRGMLGRIGVRRAGLVMMLVS